MNKEIVKQMLTVFVWVCILLVFLVLHRIYLHARLH